MIFFLKTPILLQPYYIIMSEVKNYKSPFHKNYFSFLFCDEVILRECIIRSDDMLIRIYLAISFKHVFLIYRSACSSIIRIVSIASSLLHFAPMCVYNDRGMWYTKRNGYQWSGKDLYISLSIYDFQYNDGYSDEIF